eukprot:TRINITY_DN13684_c0_g1_i2.p2 TRINITY_DN13684_c0_g1~~TRINITY_DN13684_c0_g1_i2.p2  ORF type:complete len:108 (-),score=23.15 TRINITY_DN13684_c0_g1_i2:86-376(-)
MSSIRKITSSGREPSSPPSSSLHHHHAHMTAIALFFTVGALIACVVGLHSTYEWACRILFHSGNTIRFSVTLSVFHSGAINTLPPSITSQSNTLTH